MKCLFTYEWVKLPRAHIPAGKGLMGSFLRLASRAAFRSGKARYCGYTNDVNAGAWAGGIVGLKSILGIQDRKQALLVMDELAEMGFISYSLNAKTKKLTYSIIDWVEECSGNAASGGAIYASEGHGFLCMRRCITEKLVEQGYCFCETDAWLDLWCHTVWGDPHNAFSRLAPVVQMARLRPILTLESLGARWGWEKTKVWRFFRKYAGTFSIYKLPGSYGCLLFNQLYPTDTGPMEAPNDAAIMRVLKEIRFMGVKTHFTGTDHQRINQYTLWFSKRICLGNLNNGCPSPCHPAVDRVALWTPYHTRAYSSLPKRKDDCAGETDMGSPEYRITALLGYGDMPGHNHRCKEEYPHEKARHCQRPTKGYLYPAGKQAIHAVPCVCANAGQARPHRGRCDPE